MLKAVVKIGSNVDYRTYFYLFKYNLSGQAVMAQKLEQNFASLDLKDVLSDLPNHRLFIYGSSAINQNNQSFDTYDLKLLNTSYLQNGNFYIQNNSRSNLKIFFKSTDSSGDSFLELPVGRMIEISKNSASFMEYHKKGIFYVNKNKTNTNFICKIQISLFMDNLLNYENLNSLVKPITDPQNYNVLISPLIEGFLYGSHYYYNSNASINSYFLNKHAFYINSVESMSLADAFALDINKKNISISTAGHYIFNDNNSNLIVTAQASNTFLINNSAYDIKVKKIDGANSFITTLFRNTVLVIKTGVEDRYLKKAKRRDEFYCIFNPNTAILTQREITLKYGIPRNVDIFPLLDFNNNAQQSYVKLLNKYGESDTIYLGLDNYYNGVDVPTDSLQNVVAYEVGIGHETFYKFLFFNPSNSTYTLDGVRSGEVYEVIVDDSLIRDLQSLPDSEGNAPDSLLLDPAVVYDGKEYKSGERFKGSYVSTYDVRYPNYVKIARVVSEINKTFPNQEAKADEDISEELISKDVDIDYESLFKEKITQSALGLFGSSLAWIPQNEDAFWSDSNFTKNLWVITNVDSSDTKTISYPEGSTSRYVKFTKCELKNENLKTTLFNYSYDFWSALQEKKKMPDPKNLTIGIDQDLNNTQIVAVKKAFARDYVKEDYIFNTPSMELGRIYKSDLLLDGPEVPAQLKDTRLEIKFEIYKLTDLPSIKFEDLSQSDIIKLINGE